MKNMQARQIARFSALEILFFLYLSLPLFFIPGSPNGTRLGRVVGLFLIFLASLITHILTSKTTLSFKRGSWKALAVISLLFILILLSSWQTVSSSFHLSLFGKEPDYLGLMTWVLYIGIALSFRSIALKVLVSAPSLIIGVIVLLVSLISNQFYIRYGFRVSGVMFQATTMAMYAAFVSVIAANFIHHPRHKILRFIGWFGLITAAITVLLCQSRIGLLAMAIILTCNSLAYFQKHRTTSYWLALILVCLVISPTIAKDYFARFQTQSIDRGISYRLDLYKTSGKDLLKNNVMIGNGPDTLPLAINNPDQVPEEIAATLKEGTAFNSTHDLYFDIAYFFGIIAAILCLGLTCLAVWETRNLQNLALPMFLILLSVGFNALFNVPSIELTSLLSVVIAAILLRPKSLSNHENLKNQ